MLRLGERMLRKLEERAGDVEDVVTATAVLEKILSIAEKYQSNPQWQRSEADKAEAGQRLLLQRTHRCLAFALRFPRAAARRLEQLRQRSSRPAAN
jgi:predicted DNA-binding protein